jgi:hypothetical protein
MTETTRKTVSRRTLLNSMKVLDAVLIGDDTEASAVVHSAIEDFAQELAHVTRRLLKSKAWDKTERIVVGGGFRIAGWANSPSADRNHSQGRGFQN